MSRPKRKSRKQVRKQNGMPLVALVGLVIGLFAFYLVAEGVLYLRPHPLHWLSAFGGAIVGYLFGMAWYHARGDLI